LQVTDSRKDVGELMFPERFSENQVVDLEKSLGTYATAGQLQQRPVPRGGGIFRDIWWQYWRVLPELEWRAVYADTAQKTAEHNDYTVFQCWGKGKAKGIYLIDQIRGKWEAPELLVQAKAFWFKHTAETNGTLRQMKVEDKSSGTGLIQELRKQGIPIQAIQRNKDKTTRALDVVPHVESGNVYLPLDAPFLSDYLKELSLFPNGKHDDQLDPTMDAINDMLIKNTDILIG
jgi:predicted phage terminase large subunit-like protein